MEETHVSAVCYPDVYTRALLNLPRGSLLQCWWECKLIQPLWRTVWRFLKKLQIELPYDPAIPLLGIYPEKTIIQKVMYHNDYCSIIYNSQEMEAT